MLNNKQQALVNALSQHRKAGRAIVVAFEMFLNDYVVSFNAQELDFVDESMKRFPVLNKAAVALLTKHFGLVRKDGKYTNPENMNKKHKIEIRKRVREFIAAEHASLLHHGRVKVQVSYDWSKKQASFANQVKQALEHGVTEEQLIAVLRKAKEDVETERAA